MSLLPARRKSGSISQTSIIPLEDKNSSLLGRFKEIMAVEKKIDERLIELGKLRQQSQEGGGQKRIEQQHA